LNTSNLTQRSSPTGERCCFRRDALNLLNRSDSLLIVVSAHSKGFTLLHLTRLSKLPEPSWTLHFWLISTEGNFFLFSFLGGFSLVRHIEWRSVLLVQCSLLVAELKVLFVSRKSRFLHLRLQRLRSLVAESSASETVVSLGCRRQDVGQSEFILALPQLHLLHRSSRRLRVGYCGWGLVASPKSSPSKSTCRLQHILRVSGILNWHHPSGVSPSMANLLWKLRLLIHFRGLSVPLIESTSRWEKTSFRRTQPWLSCISHYRLLLILTYLSWSLGCNESMMILCYYVLSVSPLIFHFYQYLSYRCLPLHLHFAYWLFQKLRIYLLQSYYHLEWCIL